ncbi:MAG: hypothetical protein OXG74_08610 [Acidobacteria bacterium]|nr:hypothetical protein [Acidobacteriota bacterium]
MRPLPSTILLALLFSSGTAWACSCPFVSYWGFVGPETGRMPANAHGVIWFIPRTEIVRAGGRFVSRPVSAKRLDEFTSNLRVEVLVNGKYSRLPTGVVEYKPPEDWSSWGRLFLIRPVGGFDPGSTYRFTDRNRGRWKHWPYPVYEQAALQQVTFTVDEEELAAQDVALEVSSPGTDSFWIATGASCLRKADVMNVRASVELPVPEWRGSLLYATWVDGKRWRGASSICSRIVPGRSWKHGQAGTDTIYADCASHPERLVEDGIDPYHLWERGMLANSKHTLKVQAFLPGTDVMFESEPVPFDLSCAPRED